MPNVNSNSGTDKLVTCYSNMSEGDRSCVIAIHQKPDAVQMTTAGSAHDKFYEELSRLEWAEIEETLHELQTTDSIRLWKFTEEGRRSIRTLLLTLTIGSLRSYFHLNRHVELTYFGGKFCIIYAILQSLILAGGQFLVRLDLGDSVTAPIASIAVVFVSLLISLNYSTIIWRHKNTKEKWIANNERWIVNIAYYEFLRANIKVASILAAIIVFAIHVAMEAIVFSMSQGGKTESIVQLLIKGVILIGSVYWLSFHFLPELIKIHLGRQFRVKGSA